MPFEAGLQSDSEFATKTAGANAAAATQLHSMD